MYWYNRIAAKSGIRITCLIINSSGYLIEQFGEQIEGLIRIYPGCLFFSNNNEIQMIVHAMPVEPEIFSHKSF